MTPTPKERAASLNVARRIREAPTDEAGAQIVEHLAVALGRALPHVTNEQLATPREEPHPGDMRR